MESECAQWLCGQHPSGSQWLYPQGDGEDKAYLAGISVEMRMSILSYFFSDCDMSPRDMPRNICRASDGDSMYNPCKYTDDQPHFWAPNLPR